MVTRKRVWSKNEIARDCGFIRLHKIEKKNAGQKCSGEEGWRRRTRKGKSKMEVEKKERVARRSKKEPKADGRAHRLAGRSPMSRPSVTPA